MTADVPIIHSDPDILGGTPVFAGTRVPFRTLLDHLEAGDSLNVFLTDFPSVTREQAISALRLAERIGSGSLGESRRAGTRLGKARPPRVETAKAGDKNGNDNREAPESAGT